MIGGLLVSTVLSLVFIPSFYLMINRLNRVTAWLFGKLASPNESDEPTEHAEPHAEPQPAAPARPHLVTTSVQPGPRPKLLGPDGLPIAAE